MKAEGGTRQTGSRFVGVDVVDLGVGHVRDRTRDARFLERVFTDVERARIRAAADPEVELWSLWAAKEAAFKVASKVLGAPPVFRHRAFEVRDPPGTAAAAVTYRERAFPITTQVDDTRVVVHAWSHPSSMILVCDLEVGEAEALLGVGEPFEDWRAQRMSPEELESAHSRASALVRILARRDAARHLDLPERRVTIQCVPGPTGRRPPFLHLDGAPLGDADVSLSHHGRRLAWALDLPWSPIREPDSTTARSASGPAVPPRP
jgi:phosphopantetheine--protein transferase-like protein